MLTQQAADALARSHAPPRQQDTPSGPRLCVEMAMHRIEQIAGKFAAFGGKYPPLPAAGVENLPIRRDFGGERRERRERVLCKAPVTFLAADVEHVRR